MNKLNDIIVIGMHDLGSGLTEAIARRSNNEIILVVDTEKPELNYFDTMCIKNEQLKLESIMSNEKKFKCKGKHQYRLVGTEWICECGRNVND